MTLALAIKRPSRAVLFLTRVAIALLCLLFLAGVAAGVLGVLGEIQFNAQLHHVAITQGCLPDICVMRRMNDANGLGILIAIFVAPISAFAAFRLRQRARKMVSAR